MMYILIYDMHFNPRDQWLECVPGWVGGSPRWQEPCCCHSLCFLPPRRSALTG